MQTRMIFKPDLIEAIDENDVSFMTNFCSSLQPENAADVLSDLTSDQIWTVFQHNKRSTCAKIFSRIVRDKQIEVVKTCPPAEVAKLLEELPSDDRADILNEIQASVISTFCLELHPATAADLLACLEPKKILDVFRSCPNELCAEIFTYLDRNDQIRIVESSPRADVAKLLEEAAPDDRVDLLNDVKEEVDPQVAVELVQLLSKEEQSDVQMLAKYPDEVCGAEMTTDFVSLREDMTVREAIEEIRVQTHKMETVYYLYVLDAEGRLAGVVSAKDLLRRIGEQDVKIKEFMKSAQSLVTVNANQKREDAVLLVEKYDFLAIPVIDEKTNKMLGVITHDDVLDAAVEDLVEDAHRSAAVDPLGDETYLGSNLFWLARKRLTWLAILLFGAITTALILKLFSDVSDRVVWLIAFLPMIVSTGGNSGGQSATLVITALATGEIKLKDWRVVVKRETSMGIILGLAMGALGLVNALIIYGGKVPFLQLLIVPLSVLCIVFFSNLTGALLPLFFKKLKCDPAIMSNPFVAGLSDTIGTFIYMLLALLLIAPLYPGS